MKNLQFLLVAAISATLFFTACSETNGLMAGKEVCDCLKESEEMSHDDKSVQAVINTLSCLKKMEDYSREFEKEASEGDDSNLKVYNTILLIKASTYLKK